MNQKPGTAGKPPRQGVPHCTQGGMSVSCCMDRLCHARHPGIEPGVGHCQGTRLLNQQQAGRALSLRYSCDSRVPDRGRAVQKAAHVS